MKVQTYILSFFLDQNIFGDDGLKNKFIYKPILDMLELKKDKDTD